MQPASSGSLWLSRPLRVAQVCHLSLLRDEEPRKFSGVSPLSNGYEKTFRKSLRRKYSFNSLKSEFHVINLCLNGSLDCKKQHDAASIIGALWPSTSLPIPTIPAPSIIAIFRSRGRPPCFEIARTGSHVFNFQVVINIGCKKVGPLDRS